MLSVARIGNPCSVPPMKGLSPSATPSGAKYVNQSCTEHKNRNQNAVIHVYIPPSKFQHLELNKSQLLNGDASIFISDPSLNFVTDRH